MRYAIIYEKSSTGGYGAYVPDLPGIGVVGRTIDETKRMVNKAIVMHLASMREDGDAIPEPTTQVEYAEIG